MADIRHPEDLAYARALAAGQSKAVLSFEARYRGLIDHAVGRALRRWQPESPVEPDDLAQDFISFLFMDGGRRLRTYAGHSRLSSWLYTVALRYFQRQLARRARDRRESEDVIALLPNRDEAPDRLAISREEAERLRLAVKVLPDADRLLVRLFFVEGLNATEVGRTLGKNTSAVRMKKKRILERLRVALADLADQPEAGGVKAG